MRPKTCLLLHRLSGEKRVEESLFHVKVASGVIAITTFLVLAFRKVNAKLDECRKEAIASDSNTI